MHFPLVLMNRLNKTESVVFVYVGSLYFWRIRYSRLFKRERESIEDDGRSGRPKDATADVNVKVAHILVMYDSRQDLRSKDSEVGISFGAVQLILTNILGMSKVSARWVPRMLTDDQESFRLDISRYLLSRYEDGFLSFLYEPVHEISNNVALWHVKTRTSICRLLLSLETPNGVQSVAQQS